MNGNMTTGNGNGNGDAGGSGIGSEASVLTAYEYLRFFSDAAEAETQLDILRHLEAVDVPESQRASVRELHRDHFARLLRARRDRRRDDVERISERRSQIRARGRVKWHGVSPADGLSVEQVQSQFPGLFQAANEDAQRGLPKALGGRSQQQRATVTTTVAVSSAVHPPASEGSRSTMDGSDRAVARGGRHDLAPVAPPVPIRQSTPPPQVPSVSGPRRTLSELLKKKSSANVDEDGDQVMSNPYRGQARDGRPVANGRNPFQTAGDRLQKDRATGKTFTDDFDDDGIDHIRRNGRGLTSHGARSGAYHPVNPHLLFGGGGDLYDGGDDDLDSSGAIRKKFVSPIVKPGEDRHSNKPSGQQAKPSGAACPDEDENVDPRLRSCDPELIAKIEMEIVDNGDPITFEDIAGLQFAKKCVNELVIWPMARPDIFTGLRALPKGLLLFGPPGTGKTLIGKAIANQSGATFFSISASSLTSKWIGEGEKLVRTLFAVAAVKQPSVIFIDEIDSLLTQRSSEENEASRRMKTEFLVQLDGAGTKAKDVILVVGATNRPQELDEAARRRFVKRLYIPLPSYEARMDLMNRLLKDNRHDLSEGDLKTVAEKTAGYSGADVRSLCTEAAMGPIRSCMDIQTMDADSVRPISVEDFSDALRGVRSSVAAKDLEFYKAWNDEFGSFAFVGHEG